MSFWKRLLLSLTINILIYLIAGFLPCKSSGFLNLCSDGLFEPLQVVAAYMWQFGMLFANTQPGSVVLIGFMVIWILVLSPFYFDKIKIKRK